MAPAAPGRTASSRIQTEARGMDDGWSVRAARCAVDVWPAGRVLIWGLTGSMRSFVARLRVMHRRARRDRRSGVQRGEWRRRPRALYVSAERSGLHLFRTRAVQGDRCRDFKRLPLPATSVFSVIGCFAQMTSMTGNGRIFSAMNVSNATYKYYQVNQNAPNTHTTSPNF